MAWQLFVLAVLSHVAVVAAVFGVIYGVPSLARSAYRYRLWGVRDELWDAVFRGELVGVAEAERLLASVEMRIRSVHNWSAVSLLSAMYAMHRHLPEKVQDLRTTGSSGAPESYRHPRVIGYARRVERLSLRYMRWATGFGWFRRPVVGLMQRWGAPVHDDGSDDDVEAAGDAVDREFFDLVSNFGGDAEKRPDQPLSGLA